MSRVGGPRNTSAHPPLTLGGGWRRFRDRDGQERGMVTVELAAASLLLAAVLAGVIAMVVGTFRLAECQVTANEIARQEARGDAEAVASATDDRPAGSTVTVNLVEGTVVVRAQCDATLGRIRVPMEVTARVVQEP